MATPDRTPHYWSVRQNDQDHIVYSIQDDERVVIVVRARTHCGD
jgi:Txe/YoeB family toxin of Txe-Axe toxin-antitoxin module